MLNPQLVEKHTPENTYQCSHCNKSFAIKGNLKVRQITHTEEKLYAARSTKRSTGNNVLKPIKELTLRTNYINAASVIKLSTVNNL